MNIFIGVKFLSTFEENILKLDEQWISTEKLNLYGYFNGYNCVSIHICWLKISIKICQIGHIHFHGKKSD